MVKLTWTKELQFEVEDDHNHQMVIDTDKDSGGHDQGFRPIDLLLVALAGCMSMDIVAILRKKGSKIKGFEVQISGERAVEHPRKFNKITVQFKCEGDYKRDDLLRAFELSRDKYCSVYGTLKSMPTIDFLI